MKNIATIKSSNYQQVLQPSANTYGCNYSDRNSCLLGQKCKAPQVLYQAHVSNSFDNVNKFYYGLMETSLKKMQGNHKSSFRHEIFRNATELSKDVQKFHKPEKDLQQYGVLLAHHLSCYGSISVHSEGSWFEHSVLQLQIASLLVRRGCGKNLS